MQKHEGQPSVVKILTGNFLFGVGMLVAFLSSLFIAAFFISLSGNSDGNHVVFWGVLSVFSISFALWCLLYSQKILNSK